MNRGSAVLVCATVIAGSASARCGRMDVVEYRGERIRLSRSYADFDEYKNDPDNIHPSELRRVQTLVRSAPAGLAFGCWEEVSHSALAIQFPGYGAGSLRSDWQSLRAFTFEVPKAEEQRVIVFQPEAGGWRRIDDFVMRAAPAEVVVAGSELQFKGFAGQHLTSRPLRTRE